MRTIGYVRVSTDKQAEQGVSLEAQAEKIRAMALVHDTNLLDIIVDGGESAKSLQRPGMTRLLAMVDARQVEAVIVAKLDRLTRSVKDLCELLERFERRRGADLGCRIARYRFCRGPSGNQHHDRGDQWEREAIGERTRDALSHKRRNGERVGNLPYGYRLAEDRLHLQADAAEQAVLARVGELRAGHTLRQIASRLNEQGLRTRRGSPWRLESVARVVNCSSLIQ
jgi:site-specific DNA recombinase